MFQFDEHGIRFFLKDGYVFVHKGMMVKLPKECSHGHDKAWDAACNVCTPDDDCLRTAEDDCPLEE